MKFHRQTQNFIIVFMGCVQATSVKTPQRLPSSQIQGQSSQPPTATPQGSYSSNNHHQNSQNPSAVNPPQKQHPQGQLTQEIQHKGETPQSQKEGTKDPSMPFPLQSHTEGSGSKMPFFFDGSQLSNHIQASMKETSSAKKQPQKPAITSQIKKDYNEEGQIPPKTNTTRQAEPPKSQSNDTKKVQAQKKPVQQVRMDYADEGYGQSEEAPAITQAPAKKVVEVKVEQQKAPVKPSATSGNKETAPQPPKVSQASKKLGGQKQQVKKIGPPIAQSQDKKQMAKSIPINQPKIQTQIKPNTETKKVEKQVGNSATCVETIYLSPPAKRQGPTPGKPKVYHDGTISYYQAPTIAGSDMYVKEAVPLNMSNKMLKTVDLQSYQNITRLDLSGNSLVQVDLRDVIWVQQLILKNNQLTKLDINDTLIVKKVDVSNNKLTQLITKGNEVLFQLFCSQNQISSIDFKKNRMLRNVNLSQNQLVDVDLSAAKSLQYINLSGNKIQTFTAGCNVLLKSLHLDYNKLTFIDVSCNDILEVLTLTHNPMDSIDLTMNFLLKILNVSNTKMFKLNLSKNMQLQQLYSISANLNHIDLSGCANLNILDVSHNSVMDIDLSKNSSLTSVKVEDNLLQSLNLSQSFNVSQLNASNNELMDLGFYYNQKIFKGIELANQRSEKCVVSISKGKSDVQKEADSFRQGLIQRYSAASSVPNQCKYEFVLAK